MAELIIENLEIENKEGLIDDELIEKLEEKSKILSDDLTLAKTFLICFDISNNIKDKNFIEYLNEFKLIEADLRNNFKDYGNGLEYNDWVLEQRIKNIVNSNRNKIIKFLDVFIKIFIGD